MRVQRKLFVMFMMFLLIAESCREDTAEVINHNEGSSSKIVLHWYQNDSETKADFEIGLQWCFSYLGAQLEKGSWSRGTQWISDKKIQIDFKEIGFNENAVKQFELLIRQFNLSEEFEVTGGIDAGRFVMSIFNNANHYYKIVNMPTNLNEFKSNYSFLEKRAAIIESVVAFSERIISLPSENQDINSLGYLAEELTGSLLDSTHVVKENEVMNVMENGQLRFGIYNKNWELITGADSTLSIGGKPAKCLWCHEIIIQPGLVAQTAVPGYYSPNQFDSIITLNRSTLASYRASLTPEIDFNDNSQHTELEKIYLRYLEPSAKRLAAEWSMSESEVKLKLKAYQTHEHHEFSELVNCTIDLKLKSICHMKYYQML